VRLKREDLVAGVTLINAALASGTPPDKVADTAAQTQDRGALRELVRRKPRVVYASLEAHGLLAGPLATPEGEQYFAAFLKALRSRLSSGNVNFAPQQTAEPAEQVQAEPEEETPEE
jgi:hypothetical protein